MVNLPGRHGASPTEFIVGRIVIVAPEKCQRANQKTKTTACSDGEGSLASLAARML